MLSRIKAKFRLLASGLWRRSADKFKPKFGLNLTPQNERNLDAKSCDNEKFSGLNLPKSAQILARPFCAILSKFSPRNIPIALRVTLWYSVFIFGLIGVLIGISAAISDELAQDVSQKRLVKAVEQIARGDDEFEAFDDGIFFIKYSGDGAVIAGGAPKNFNAALPKSGAVAEYAAGESKFLYYDSAISGGWVRGVVSIDGLISKIDGFFAVFAVLLPLLFALIIYGGHKIIKSAFLPVVAMSQTAWQIKNSGDFSKRIEVPRGKDELTALAGLLNEMLGSLEAHFRRERQLVSDVSHELRTPVSIVLAQSDYALNYELDAAEAREGFEIISRQSNKMKLLIEQILELARLQSAENLALNRLNLSQILDRALDDYELLLAQRGLNLRRQIAPNVQIYGDELLLSRLIDNLLSNAIKFTRTFVEISLSQSGELAVKDDGIGIAQDECALVWEKFYQADRSRNKAQNGGAGLGLAVVAQVAKLHGAQVFLDSELGRGSVFGVRLKAV